MGAATATETPLIDSHKAETQILTTIRCNVLVEGAVSATQALVRVLRPSLSKPIHWHRSHAHLDLPRAKTRTLILTDVAALDAEEQRQLLEWTLDVGSATQIISLTTRPLFALVAGGLFDGALYYRLNAVLLRADG
jgi:Sigma-54 interaction domain